MSSSWWDPFDFFGDNSTERLSREQWEWQKQKYEQNYEEQQQRYEDQWNFQQDAYDYQVKLNRMQMEREDDAVQRRVADLKAAGLSPTLAAGSASSATPVRAGSVGFPTVPQYEVGENPRIQASMFKQQMFRDNLALISSVLGNVADVSRTKAETELLRAQTDKLVGETPVDLKLKELDQVLRETTLNYEIESKARDLDLKELRIINDQLSVKLMESDVAMKAYDLRIREIESKYADREHKAGVEKTEAEKDKVVQEVKEKSIAVEMAEFLRDKTKEAGVPIEMMSPAFKNFYSFKSYGAKQASEPGPGGVPFKDTKAGKFLKKIFVKSPGLNALKAAALSN